jgi:transposase InsO family protein
MAYTTNPYVPKLRAKAVQMVESGRSVRAVSRYFGVSPGAVSKWMRKASTMTDKTVIPTLSSRPHAHPAALPTSIVDRIVTLRQKTKGRCAEVIHQHLKNEQITVSLSSVKRTLDRQYLTKKRNHLKRYHGSPKRPLILAPGDLVQIDTIHLMQNEKQRLYVYTLIDLYSRWAYAWATDSMSCRKTLAFVNHARQKFPFEFKCLQSDHGPEFSQHFSERIHISHRHSRVRRPNDNAHLERFNRTLQEELLDDLPRNARLLNRYLPKYLKHYNEQRLHLGINLQTPAQLLKCFQAID